MGLEEEFEVSFPEDAAQNPGDSGGFGQLD